MKYYYMPKLIKLLQLFALQVLFVFGMILYNV